MTEATNRLMGNLRSGRFNQKKPRSSVRDAQTAKPQAFRTGDGWFPYNPAVNLAQME